MPGAEKQKAWLSDQAFAAKYGFETVDTTPDGYRLLARSFDGNQAALCGECQAVGDRKLGLDHLLIAPSVPHPSERRTGAQDLRGELEVPYTLIPVDTGKKPKALPGVFNNWAVFIKGSS